MFSSSSQLLEPLCPYPVVDVTNVSVHEVRQPEGARGQSEPILFSLFL